MGHNGVERDFKKAMKYFREAAEKGNVEAIKNVGVMYYNGSGLSDVDYKNAAKWFKNAADKGHSGAMEYLGIMYKNGEGVEQDINKANEYFRKAEEIENSDY